MQIICIILLTFYENEIFLNIPLSITFLNLKVLDFLFLQKLAQQGSKMWEIKLQKIVGNLLEKLRKLYLKGTVI